MLFGQDVALLPVQLLEELLLEGPLPGDSGVLGRLGLGPGDAQLLGLLAVVLLHLFQDLVLLLQRGALGFGLLALLRHPGALAVAGGGGVLSLRSRRRRRRCCAAAAALLSRSVPWQGQAGGALGAAEAAAEDGRRWAVVGSREGGRELGGDAGSAPRGRRRNSATLFSVVATRLFPSHRRCDEYRFRVSNCLNVVSLTNLVFLEYMHTTLRFFLGRNCDSICLMDLPGNVLAAPASACVAGLVYYLPLSLSLSSTV